MAVALDAHPQLSWLGSLVKIGAIAGMTSVILMSMLGQPRIFLAMADDGLLPPAMRKVHPKYRTPHVATAITTVLAAAIAGLFPLNILGELISMGILLAVFTVEAAGGLEAMLVGLREAGHADVLQFLPRLSAEPPAGVWEHPLIAWSATVLATFLVYILFQWWANKNADGGAVVIQRMAASKDEREAVLGTLWFQVANYALRPWPWVLVALASLLLYPAAADHELSTPRRWSTSCRPPPRASRRTCARSSATAAARSPTKTTARPRRWLRPSPRARSHRASSPSRACRSWPRASAPPSSPVRPSSRSGSGSGRTLRARPSSRRKPRKRPPRRTASP